MIDLKTMAVKICNFDLCCDGGKEKMFFGKLTDGYRRDLSSVAYNMAHLYLGEDFSGMLYTDVFIINRLELFLETKKEGGVLSDNGLGMAYKEMEKLVSKNGLNLFLKLLASKNTGGYTTAAEALKHPFFVEGREQDPLPKEPKRRLFIC
ncbi:MAG: uncharacterized protein A8A55_2063 [Amphiamblys sp. WSBS2006]|nr:MAG: uncharacterized protein A8A55_2063 [Amphiamblys sp. WSBS2006]